MNDASDAFAFVHQIERIVNLVQIHIVGDELVDLEFASKILFNELWDAIDTLVPTKCCSFPDSSGNYQLIS